MNNHGPGRVFRTKNVLISCVKWDIFDAFINVLDSCNLRLFSLEKNCWELRYEIKSIRKGTNLGI